MSENIVELKSENFDDGIKKGKWIVDFWAPWCGPCKIMSPHFDAAAKDFKGKVNFAKVNIDENYEVANQFSVMSIPTIMFFNDGEVVHVEVGAMSKDQIVENVNNVFK